MKKFLYFMIISVMGILCVSCGKENQNMSNKNTYESISAEDAKKLMDTEDNYVILDVRTQEEYDEGHIVNAVLLPDYDVKEKAQDILKDKEQLILVYCRSGRRSKNAASILADLGYTNVKEFGGIIDWPYDTEK